MHITCHVLLGVLMSHPDWATAHKKKGTELRCIRGKYYLYEVSSYWDKQRKRPVKKTGICLGSISQENGFKPSRQSANLNVEDFSVNPKIFGAFVLFEQLLKSWIQPLKKHFPDYWKQIVCMVYARLFKRSPIKNMNFFFEKSMYSVLFKSIAFSDKTISKILNDIGKNQGVFEAFMSGFIKNDDVVLVDATPIFSKSKNIHESRLGYNNKKQWDTQVNLLYLYSGEHKAPLFFKLSPGDVREVKTFESALRASGIKNVVIVGDKGFTSRLNLEIIEDSEMNYILPLRRNDSFIDYSKIPTSKTTMNSYFKFQDRYIWYYSENRDDGKRVTVYLDDKLRISEEQDYLNRIENHPEDYNIRGFHEKQQKMGTLALIDNLADKSAEEIYQTYKSRCEIEQLFDIFKNELEADKTYMHSIESLKGFIFINHLAVVCYYQIYQLLKRNGLLSKHSVNDILEYVYHINSMKYKDKWMTEKISEKNNKMLKKIGITIPITWNRES